MIRISGHSDDIVSIDGDIKDEADALDRDVHFVIMATDGHKIPNPHRMPPLCRGWVPMHLKDRRHGGDITEFPEDLRIREFPRSVTT